MNVHSRVEEERRLAAARAPVRTPRRRVLLVAALILAAAALAFWFVARKPAAAPVAEAPAPVVSVLVPGVSPVVAQVVVTGSIAARRDMPVGVQGEGGQVVTVLVEAGDRVRAGQVLARLDKAVQVQVVSQLAAAVRQARADAALAQAELDRANTLVARGFISKADIERRTATRDANEARVAVAEAQLREAQAMLGRLDVRSPADCLVLERTVEPGQVVGPGSAALFRIAERSQMEMRGAVAEQDLPRLKVGQPAEVSVVGSPKRFHGTVWLLEPVVHPETRQGEVRIALGYDPLLRPGAFARGVITVGEASQPLLPQSAVQSDEQGSYVLVVGADDRVSRRPVVVGDIGNEGVSIGRGLTGRERIVASAGAFLTPGEKIRPRMVERP